MKSTLFFQLFFNIFLAICGIALGISVALYPIASSHYEPFFVLIDTYPWILPLVGALFALVCFGILFWSFPLFAKGRFEAVSGKMKLWMHEGLIKKELETFWNKKFASSQLSCTAYLHKNKLHIVAELPQTLSSREKEILLKDLKIELQNHLKQIFGYFNDFSLSCV